MSRRTLRRIPGILPTALLGLLALTSCQPEAGELAGTYVRSHSVFVLHGSEPVEVETQDLLKLEESDGGLEVTLRLNADGGENCRMEGLARPRSGVLELRPAAIESCVLQLRQDGDSILVEDVNDGCRAAFCTGEASVGRIAFRIRRPLGQRTPSRSL